MICSREYWVIRRTLPRVAVEDFILFYILLSHFHIFAMETKIITVDNK